MQASRMRERPPTKSLYSPHTPQHKEYQIRYPQSCCLQNSDQAHKPCKEHLQGTTQRQLIIYWPHLCGRSNFKSNNRSPAAIKTVLKQPRHARNTPETTHNLLATPLRQKQIPIKHPQSCCHQNSDEAPRPCKEHWRQPQAAPETTHRAGSSTAASKYTDCA